MKKKLLEKLKNKKALAIVIAALVVIIVVVLIIVLNRKETYRNVVVNDQSGTVGLERNQSAIEIVKNMKLIPNDFVSVGEESLLDLLVDTDKHIAVRSNTKFSVDAIGNPNKGLVTLNVTEGKSYIKIDNPLEPDDGFLVVTPNATISVRGTTFTVAYYPVRGVTRVECVEGKVNVTSNSGEAIDLLAGDVVEVVDVMTTSTLTQPEIDAIENVFLGGDGVIETENDESIEEGADADEAIEDTEEEIIYVWNTAEEIMLASVGDIVTYGTYAITRRSYNIEEAGTIYQGPTTEEAIVEQNEATPIEWIVLENDGSSVTLLSKNILDNVPYHNDNNSYVTWENSDIRTWLNEYFYNTAFTEIEKSHIQITTCINVDNPFYGMPGGNNVLTRPGKPSYPAGGNNTEDKVYLLSIADLETYFGITTADYGKAYSDYDRRISAEIDWDTYAALCKEKSGGILTTEWLGNYGESWWLRSPGNNSYSAATVGYNCAVSMEGIWVYWDKGVRPVIRIGL